MLNSIDRSYDLYLLLLKLPVELAEWEDKQHEIGKNKHLPTPQELNPNRRFVENKAIKLISESEQLAELIATRQNNTEQHKDLIKALYKELSSSQYYADYMSNNEYSYDNDLQILINFYVETLQHSEVFENYLEEESILWIGDLNHILPSITRTLQSIKKEDSPLKVMYKYKSKDDREFAKVLIQKTLVNYLKYQERIDKFTSNWDVERIVFMDNLIITFAMTEFMSMESVPIKVTLDEYIDIAKEYSTPGSSVFVNGVLDKISNSLLEDGEINKSGRGLM
ncbi:MAG: transcription antitermination protein NusB [Rikenellaceae bacterium]